MTLHSMSRLDLEGSHRHAPGQLVSEAQDHTNFRSSVSSVPHSSTLGQEISESAHPKHGQMPQHHVLFNSSVKEEREEQSRGKTRSDSLSISFDRSAFPSGKRVSHSAPCSTVASPLQEGTGDDSTDKEESEGEEMGDGSTSTLVSLPLTFPDTLEGVDMAMPDFGPQQAQRHGGGGRGSSSMECLGGGVSQDKMKMQHLSTDSIKTEDRPTATSKREKSKSVLWMCVHECSYYRHVWVGGHCWFILYSYL